MAEIRTETIIHASPQKIWQKLTNFKDYPRWNPLIPRANGESYLGSTVAISLSTPMGMSVDIDVKITQRKENQEMHWVGSFPIFNFLITGDHYFKLEKLGEGKTRFIHGEHFTGLLAPFLAYIIESQGTPLYQELNEAIKTECEKRG